LQNDLDNYTLRSNEEYDDDEEYEEEYEDEEEYEEEDDDNKEYDDKKSEAKSKSKAKSKSNSKAIPKLDIVNNTDNENATNDDNDKQNVETIIIPSKKVSMKNYKKFDKVLDENDKEFDYFKNNLSENLQVAAIDKLNKIKQLTNIEKPKII
jgi:AP-4 complex subunit epsilon-1